MCVPFYEQQKFAVLFHLTKCAIFSETRETFQLESITHRIQKLVILSYLGFFPVCKIESDFHFDFEQDEVTKILIFLKFLHMVTLKMSLFHFTAIVAFMSSQKILFC